MAVGGHPLSRNPNVCASCSSMVDGMEESGVPDLASAAPAAVPEFEQPSPPEVKPDKEIILDWASGRVSKTTSGTLK